MSYKYFMDANVLSTSKIRATIETDFFKANCIVLDEIAYELQGTSIGDSLQRLAQSPDIDTLKRLGDIIDDLVRLSILQTDHGNGDALLIAAALSLKDGAGGQGQLSFMQDQPVIVTDEKLVDVYAKKRGLDAISGDEFMKILSAVEGGHEGVVVKQD